MQKAKFWESMEFTVLVKSTDGRRAYVYGANKPVHNFICRLFGHGSMPYMYDDYSRVTVSPDQFDQLIQAEEEDHAYVMVEILDYDCTPYPTC